MGMYNFDKQEQIVQVYMMLRSAGTIKRKPSMKPSLPLTSITRQLKEVGETRDEVDDASHSVSSPVSYTNTGLFFCCRFFIWKMRKNKYFARHFNATSQSEEIKQFYR